MSDNSNDVEVDVDQRALVNILSRYPGPFDVLRELIQNADDADDVDDVEDPLAHSIEIHFQTGEPQESRPASGDNPDVSKVKVRKWIIKNHGRGFKDEDWDRLGKIAAGNKNTSKVGAFGVGFYSVLSKSDRPLVKSNGKSLQFYREENGKLRMLSAECSTDSWTSVELELMKPELLPKLPELTGFLISSVAFLTNTKTVSVHLDNQRILHIQRDQVGSSVDIPIRQHLKSTTSLQILKVKSIKRTVQRIAVDAAEWAFPSTSPSSSAGADPDALVERPARLEEDRPICAFQNIDAILKDDAITHDLYTAVTCVDLDNHTEMKQGVESSMKSLPTEFECKAVYFNPDQSLAGIEKSDLPKAKQFARLFCGSQGIFPENDSGRLFIGQSTNQTTGIGLHVSAHFLPTMERGAIDLANGQVKSWNEEVLHISGFLARQIYEEEMDTAKTKGDLATQLVSQILQDAFFSCSRDVKSPFPVVSDTGITCASNKQLRQSNKDLSFLKKCPVLHEKIESGQRSQIIDRCKIPLFKFGDIVHEFAPGASRDAMRLFLNWWEGVDKEPTSSASQNALQKFCEAFPSRGILRLGDGASIQLKNIKYFTFLPLPSDLCPQDTIYIDSVLGVPSVGALQCFGWTQLQPLYWLECACSKAPELASIPDSGRDSSVGYRILSIFVQFTQVEFLSTQQWDQAAKLMKDLKCIPTNMGSELPSKSYFDEAAVCEGLPIAKETEFLSILPPPGAGLLDLRHVRMVLEYIGVRKIMDWKDLIEGLERGTSEESNYRLLQYLIIILGGKFTEGQIKDLKERPIFHSESHGRLSATALLLPNEDVRTLGLPTLALRQNGITSLQALQDDSNRSSTFVVETFLESLGIQKYPTLEKIIAQAASDELAVRRPALQHLLRNLGGLYKAYQPTDFAEVAFIPTKCGSLARLNEVFSSPVWENLGLEQASEDFGRELSRLGVKEDPSVDTIIDCFKTPECKPSDIPAATRLFEHLCLSGILPVPVLRDQLSTIPFVPVKIRSSSSEPSSPAIQYFSPKECFVASPDTKKHHRDIFPFANFGQKGNTFVENCQARKSLEALDIVRKIVQNPQAYLDDLGNERKDYLDDLRVIASRLDSLSEEKEKMKKARMFPVAGGSKITDLFLAEQVLIGDWESLDFGRDISVAPTDDVLEKMYREMGSVSLGTYVRYDVCPSGSKPGWEPQFTVDQVIWRIRCLLGQLDRSRRTEVSFGDQGTQGSTNYLQVKACRRIQLRKTFAPPYEVLGDGVPMGTVETRSVRIRPRAGIRFNEDDESHTLWIVQTGSKPASLYNDIAVALCHVLLKNYGPNDVFLLASLFTMSDDRLEKYYGSEIKSEVRNTPIDLPPKTERRKPKNSSWRFLRGRHPTNPDRQTRPTGNCEKDSHDAIERWGTEGETPDFNSSCQPPPPSLKMATHKCQYVPNSDLVEKENLQDEETKIRFFIEKGVQCRQSPPPALKEFAKLVSDLARVFGRENASTGCYIFWKETEDDLMAFNREQKYIFLNLAHYHKSYPLKDAERKKVIIEWYLIMAHEIAHNRTTEHDEYHGSLTARLAIKCFPALQKCFGDVSWEHAGLQPPPST